MSVTMEPHVPPSVPGRGRRAASAVVPPLLAFAVFFGGWELLVRTRDISELVLPAPSAIAQELWDDPGYWWSQAVVTAQV